MGDCCSKHSNNIHDDQTETSPLVAESSNSGSTVPTITSSSQLPLSVVVQSRSSSDAAISPTQGFMPKSYVSGIAFPAPIPATPIDDHDKSAFVYLRKHQQYKLSQPEIPLPELQIAFGNLFARYDFALQVRVKVDEKLNEFKSVLGVHPALSMSLCFQRWRQLIDNPTFTINYTKTQRRDVKTIVVRASDIPRNLWPAQKYIRETLEACHLYLEQYEFLQQVINEWLTKTDKLLDTLPTLLSEEGSELVQVDKQYILELVPRMRTEYIQSLDWVRTFYEQIITLLDEIQGGANHLTQ